MTNNWKRYAAERSVETIKISEQVLLLTEGRRLSKEEAQLLRLLLEQGAAGLTELLVCMRAQNADTASVKLIAALEDAWAQLINVVDRYAELEAATKPVRQLRLVSSRST